VLSCVGSGGMSVVYKARDCLLNRIVAVKLLRSQSSLDTKNVQRFRQEAVAALKMDHPNIIRVFEFDIPEQGEPYLVMEYLEGESVADLITENGPIELTRAISIMQAVCAGLEHAHKVGILHRDLKPSNIMLVKDQSGTKVKLFDFGIAKLLLGEGEPDHALTMTGEFLGSPLYMSPEQISTERLDERSDIYGLGCVFYQMVTGQPPFRGSSLLETLQMHTSTLARPVKEIYAGVKNDWAIDAFLLKALAKNRDNRFQTVGEFNSALSSLQSKSTGDVLSRTKFQLDLLKHKLTEKQVWKMVLVAASSIFTLFVTLLIYFTNSSRLFDDGRRNREESCQHRKLYSKKIEH
jgi:eukaryotic-like serine/threonine-protein kinase